MIAGAGIVAVPDAFLLFAVSRTDARIHVEHERAFLILYFQYVVLHIFHMLREFSTGVLVLGFDAMVSIAAVAKRF
jgi:hypothetical protein